MFRKTQRKTGNTWGYESWSSRLGKLERHLENERRAGNIKGVETILKSIKEHEALRR